MDAEYSPEFLARRLGKFPPTGQQKQVIEAPFEPLLVVAGAGAGKTSTITDRIVWMIANGFVRSENILGVTFTRKAASELAARVRQQLMLLERAGVELVNPGDDGDEAAAADGRADFGEPQISTYHAYAHNIVSEYGMYIGVEPDSLLMSSAVAWQLGRSIVEDYDGEYKHFTAAAATLVRAIISLSAECSEHLVAIDEVRSYVDESLAYLESLPQDQAKKKSPTLKALKIIDSFKTRSTLADFVAEYQRIKAEQSLLDFGDLIVYAARIATEVPYAVRVERSKYQAVILDEFQDTSVAQLKLFSALFGGGHAVTAVGDPQQSVYGFRGASAAGLYSFIHEFPRHEGENSLPADVKYLLTSWRNSRAVLDVANQFAGPLASSQYPVEVLNAAPNAGPGIVSVNFYSQDSLSDKVPSESEAIAAEVKKLQREGLRIGSSSAVDKASFESKRTPSIAVLCRRRSQFAALQRAFDHYGVAYEVVGLGGLLDTPEVIDLVSMLRIIADPLRSDSMMRIISGARFRLGAADLMVLREWAKMQAYGFSSESEGFVTENFDAVSLVDVLDNLPSTQWVSVSGRSLSSEAYRRLKRLNQDVKYLRSLDQHDLMALIDETEKAMLLDIEVASKPGVDIHRARANLDAFRQAALVFIRQGATFQSLRTDAPDSYAWRKQQSVSSPPIDLGLFLSWIDVVSEQEDGLDMPPQPVRPGVAQLLTVHASKGLEWDAVFVPGLAQGIFPSDRSVSWTGADPGSLPWPLRGDYGAMEAWDWDFRKEDLKAVEAAWDDHRQKSKYYAQKEERRLAYVAVTRARSYLWLSASAWYGSNSRPKEASCYLAEAARMACNYRDYADLVASASQGNGAELPSQKSSAAAVIGYWEDNIPDKSPKGDDPAILWPIDPLGWRRPEVEQAADKVRACLGYDSGKLVSYIKENIEELAGIASFDQIESLLGQAAERQGQKHRIPEHIPASVLVSLSEDAKTVVSQWQRPMPAAPSKAARFGTLFHRWVEEYLTGDDIPLDIEVPEFTAASDAALSSIFDITLMKKNFLNSPWAYKRAYAVEESIETKISSLVVRGKIDAIYRELQKDGTYVWEIVDWKTGAVPDGEKELAEKAVQLSLYRLAYSRIHKIAPEKIRATFFYVKYNKILRPTLVGEEELTRLIKEAVESDEAGIAG